MKLSFEPYLLASLSSPVSSPARSVDENLQKSAKRMPLTQRTDINAEQVEANPKSQVKGSPGPSSKYRSMEIQAGLSKLKPKYSDSLRSRRLEQGAISIKQKKPREGERNSNESSTSLNRSTRLTRSQTVGCRDEPICLFVRKLNMSLQTKGTVEDMDLFSRNDSLSVSSTTVSSSTRRQHKTSLNEPDFKISKIPRPTTSENTTRRRVAEKDHPKNEDDLDYDDDNENECETGREELKNSKNNTTMRSNCFILYTNLQTRGLFLERAGFH